MIISSSTNSSWLTSSRFAPVTTIDSGTPRPSTKRWRLLPFFSPIGRVWTNRLTGKRGFYHDAVYALPSPGDSLHLIIFGKSFSPEGNKKTCFHPAQKMGMDCTGTAKPFFGQCFPLATSPENIQNGFKHLAWRYRLPTATSFAFVCLRKTTVIFLSM